jgi:hypothetical protein
MKFYINIINPVVVYRQFFLLKKWTKVHANFFLFFCREENPKVKLLGFILHPQAVTLREQEDGLQIINILLTNDLN